MEATDNTTADVLELTGGDGVDVAIEAVGYPETLLTAASWSAGRHHRQHRRARRPGFLPMQDMWIQNVTLTMGLVDTVSIPTLLKMVASGRIPAETMGTHSFTFAEMDEAYDVFKNAAENSALKVVIAPVLSPPDFIIVCCQASYTALAAHDGSRPVQPETFRPKTFGSSSSWSSAVLRSA